MGGVGNWGSLQGYIGLRAAEEARLGEFCPGEYEKQNRNPSNWVPLEEFGGCVDLSAAEERADAWRAREYEQRARQFHLERRDEFFDRLRQSRMMTIVVKGLIDEARSKDDLYKVVNWVNDFDAETPDWMKDAELCDHHGLFKPLDGLLPYVERQLYRKELLIQARAAHSKRQANGVFLKASCMEQGVQVVIRREKLDRWIDKNQNKVVIKGPVEGYLFTFRARDQWAIAQKEA